MASRIERVEKEFILVSAAELGTLARIQAPGRTLTCKLSAAGKEHVSFTLSEADSGLFKAWEHVSVHFEFRGQSVSFSAPIRKVARCILEIVNPDVMYRSLSRQWPRVAAPRNLSVDLLLPDADLQLPCPECREYADVELPTAQDYLDANSLSSLISDFKQRSGLYASESRVVMWKEGKGPADPAETLIAELGRVLYIPSVLSGIPVTDPFPESRIVTRSLLEDYEGPVALAGDSPIRKYLEQRSRGGLAAGLWCPILYYRYAVGFVYLGNNKDCKRPLDLKAVDFAWNFSRILAWFLKRYSYFHKDRAEPALRRGTVRDVSLSGALIDLGAKAPRLKPGASVELLLSLESRSYNCRARVARRHEEKGHTWYGLSFDDLTEESQAELAKGLYGLSGPTAPFMES